MKRHHLLLSLLICLLLAPLLPPAAETEGTKGSPGTGDAPPNFILLLSDTLRADYLGSYGFEGDISPTLDALASESTLFEHAVAPAPWTKPSVASLFTSLLPQTHRVVDHEGQFWRTVKKEFKTSSLPSEAVTLAEVLKGGGYRTAGWSGNGWITKGLGFAQGFDEFASPDGEEDNLYDGRQVWNPALQWLRKTRNDSSPFFLYLHFMDVHAPWKMRPEDYQALRNSPSVKRHIAKQHAGLKWSPHLGRKIREELEDRTLPSWRAVYASEVRAFDRHLAIFIQELREAGLLENTWLIFTADHGEELMDHSTWGHGRSLYEEQLAVPLIVRPPGRHPGRREKSVVSLVDVMPTMIAAAGLAAPPTPMQGTNLLPLLEGRKAGAAAGDIAGRAILSSGVKQAANQVALRRGDLKLIWNPDRKAGGMLTPEQAEEIRYQLFDLSDDSAEQENLVSRSKQRFDEMKLALQAELAKLDAIPTLLETEAPLSPEEVEKLKSLGYVN